MRPRTFTSQAVFLLTLRRSEYSDEIARLNKKEEIILARRLKVFERQERVAQSLLLKHRRDVERLERTVLETSRQSINLAQYDRARATARNAHYGRPPADQSLASVHAHRPSQLGQTWRHARVSKHNLNMMSMRAMKTGVVDRTVSLTD